MQANQRKTMEIARTELNQILTELAQKEVKKILENINDKLEQRQIYAAMEPIDIINDLIEICRGICHSEIFNLISLILRIIYLDYPSFQKISQALQIIKSNPMLRNIFQIAICHGHLAIPDQTIQSKKPVKKTERVTSKKIYFESSDSEVESPEPVINHPNENEILQAFKEQIGAVKTISFTLLFRIEQRLCEKFKITHFHELGYGTFINYIQQNEQVLFPVDTKFHLSSSEVHDSHPTVVTSFEDLEQFILQALDRSIDQHYIEQIVCYHFQTESFEQLGHGSFRSVLNTIQQNKKSKNRFIHYECIMLDEIPLLKAKSFLEGTDYYLINSIKKICLFRS
jgi:hypothetical protein